MLLLLDGLMDLKKYDRHVGLSKAHHVCELKKTCGFKEKIDGPKTLGWAWHGHQFGRLSKAVLDGRAVPARESSQALVCRHGHRSPLGTCQAIPPIKRPKKNGFGMTYINNQSKHIDPC